MQGTVQCFASDGTLLKVGLVNGHEKFECLFSLVETIDRTATGLGDPHADFLKPIPKRTEKASPA
jgi:hypothetical protein